ncbi:MAG: 50S ribosomal protein L18 [Chloroflexi bacterium]|nr:50S ribosomal protein L18 [Chloroflexota bacterium]
MVVNAKAIRVARARRHRRVRAKVAGTPERPRLSVFRSHGHIYAQIIDDTTGRTLAAASSLEREAQLKADGASKIRAAGIVGELVAERARGRGITKVVFDRGGYLYHGRVKALAEGARSGGLEL